MAGLEALQTFALAAVLAALIPLSACGIEKRIQKIPNDVRKAPPANVSWADQKQRIPLHPPVGYAWRTLRPTPPFLPARMSTCMVVFHGKLMVLGGLSSSWSISLNDVWLSPDALTWTEVHAWPRFSPRYAAGCAVHGEQVVILAGMTHCSNKMWFPIRSVWVTPDGRKWFPGRDGDFPPRERVGLVAFRGDVWLVGGCWGFSTFNDVWRSSDPLRGTWSKVVERAPFSPRCGMEITTFQGRIWIAGGTVHASEEAPSDVWSTPDGHHWILAMAAAPFSSRSAMALQPFQGQLFLLGGFTAEGPSAEVWVS
eukprot:RCo054869